MKTKEKLSKVSEVVHYLYGCIRRSDGINDLLPGESELCRKFGFARGTVQRAVNELMKTSYIIKKPGRHGLYINPEMAGLVPVAVGVVMNKGISEKKNEFRLEYREVEQNHRLLRHMTFLSRQCLFV